MGSTTITGANVGGPGNQNSIPNQSAITGPLIPTGATVVWEDLRNADDPNDGRNEDANSDIYLLELATGREVQVTSLPGPERRPRVMGTRVFFVADDLIGQAAVFMIDLVEAGLIDARP